jgi:hypothetical protein
MITIPRLNGLQRDLARLLLSRAGAEVRAELLDQFRGESGGATAQRLDCHILRVTLRHEDVVLQHEAEDSGA